MKPINFPLIIGISCGAFFVLLAAGIGMAYRDTWDKKEEVTPEKPITAQDWAIQVARAKGDKVYLRLGDRAGGGGSSDDARLSIALLSPTLKNYPKATTFTVSWSYTAAMGTDVCELIYSRKKGTLNFHSHWRGSPPYLKRFQGITDFMIHSAAREHDSYTNIKNYQP